MKTETDKSKINLLQLLDKFDVLLTKTAFLAGVIECMAEAYKRGCDMEEEALFGFAAYARKVHEEAVSLNKDIPWHDQEAAPEATA